ncbi:Adaptive-response sensory-kinase SasA [Halomonadaceae bacterium LMG 33818]|uniref:sensor histidine kinase n=1 Tax=Cernens ardua TaxID=3402176 RepID=UPI003EDC62B2
MKQYRQNLSRRITVTFLFLSFVIATVFSLGVTFTITYTERHLVLLDLGRDLTRIIQSHHSDHYPVMDQERFFYQSSSDGNQLPKWLRKAPEGFSEHKFRHNWYHIVRRDVNGKSYIIIQRQNDFERRERRIHRIVFVCWLLSMLLAFISARLMVRRAILPVRRLAQQVNDIQGGTDYQPLATSYPRDEVGSLAGAFDTAFTQANRLLQREREFTGAVSHELRSPLMAQQGALELLGMTALSSRQQDLLDRMERAHQQMGELVSAFLLLARERKDELNNVPTAYLKDVIQQQADYWQETAQHRHIRVLIRIVDDDPTPYPAPLLHSVVGNLLRNAVHYSQPGEILFTLGNGYFHITDQAPSIPKESLEQLFTPLVRGTSEGDGLGLGLAIVRRICLFLDWQIQHDIIAPKNLDHQSISGVNRFSILLYPSNEEADQDFRLTQL